MTTGIIIKIITGKYSLHGEAKFILADLFLKGKISKAEAMCITNTSDKEVDMMNTI